ncbi:hypothetical protein MSIMFB_02331 [Mycobacterium simulans]|uniref:DUF3556 domain-containing protein n=1 Tax=Mycobacterium simulans TaxID=627089 RepID=A0A7Z7N9K3_9MYCO|nr:DUF3556 domain-containing protein [Mycobacterium simulans]SOJ54839.1 hypothetical protein MSIMFB_02331 [Mycobacterium simulans]
MGFMSPELPDVDHATWPALPRATRLQVVTRHWAEHGFGTPYAVYLLYLFKIALYIAAPAAIISLTPGLGGLSHIGDWWTQPIVYQKVIIFTLLFEVLGLGCGSGPLTGRFMPPIGGVLYWLRPNTIRLPAWPDKVPFTRGDTRTIVDVALYAIVLIGGVWALLSSGSPGQGGSGLTAAGDVGLINPVVVIPTIVALALLGLRDKTIFLAARGEHYWLKLFVFFFPFTDQIAAFKIIMLCLWWGAATSKLNHHFPYVVAVMTSNNALLRSRLFRPIKRLLYLDHVNDLRPSWLPKLMAHVGGTTAEFLVPAVLVLVADGQPWRWFLIGFMVIFHLNILSNLPMGVPLEWNVFFIFSLFYLFGHYGAIEATDLRSPLLLVILIVVVAIVIAGNMFPEKISFLPAMRYYAGNWATSIWCFRAGAEDNIEANIVKSSALVVNQLAKLYDADTAEVMADKVAAFRAMHTHGRALNGLIPRAIDNDADYKVREGEIVAGPLLGWNFGEGHLHNEQLLAAVQRRCNFAEGDVRVIILEGQPIHVQKQWYRIVDAKTGLIESGYVNVEDMLSRQPWPETGDEFPVHITTQPVVHGES